MSRRLGSRQLEVLDILSRQKGPVQRTEINDFAEANDPSWCYASVNSLRGRKFVKSSSKGVQITNKGRRALADNL